MATSIFVHRCIFVSLLSFGLTTLNAIDSIAQETVPETRIASLVRNLGSESYQARKDASQELEKLGKSGVEHLETASRSNDTEVSLRASQLLKRIATNELWGGSFVELSTQETTLPTLLKSIERQTGNSFLLANSLSEYNNKPFEMTVAHGSFWEILDAACTSSGHSYRPHYNPRMRGQLISTIPLEHGPVTYAGALRGQLQCASRTYSETIDYRKEIPKLEQTFTMQMNVIWEDRLRIVAYQKTPIITRAITTSGQELKSAESDTPSWNILGEDQRQLAATLKLVPPSVQDNRLKELVLVWPMIAVGEMNTVTLEKPRIGSTLRQDDISLFVESMELDPEADSTIVLRIQRDLILPEPEEVLLEENELELLDDTGRVIQTRTLENSVRGGVARMELGFHLREDAKRISAIRLSYPQIRDAKGVEFVFKQVLLPTSVPK